MLGFGTFIGVVEALGDAVDAQTVHVQEFGRIRARRGSATPTLERAARRFCRTRVRELAAALAAFGSEQRLRILAGLLEGPATYRWLQKRTGLKAGPLYFHIHQLRLAGLVGPKARDTYVLTRAGRNSLLVALSLGAFLRDPAPRPMPEVLPEGAPARRA